LQELHEPSISKALAKATKVVESSQEAPPLNENITESLEIMEIHSDWRTSFMAYLRTGGLPKDKVKHEQLRHQARQYTLVNNELFWRSVNDILIKCTTLDECCAIL
jgi:hypothetical protein